MSVPAAVKRIFVVAGVGAGSGTGAATARLFAKSGYQVALIARNAKSLEELADEINKSGGEAGAFAVESYTPASIKDAFQRIQSHWTGTPIRVALFNAGYGVWKPFLEITPEEVETTINTNVFASFAFAHEALTAITKNDIEDPEGRAKKGTVLFTGATAAIRGNTTTSAFAAAKHGVRALSQSLNKEFGKQDIHVAHAIIDGGILTERARGDPASKLKPDSIAQSYLYLVNQDKTAWTWELDLRPAHEKW